MKETIESFAAIVATWFFSGIMSTLILKRWFDLDPDEVWFFWKTIGLLFAIRMMIWAWNRLP